MLRIACLVVLLLVAAYCLFSMKEGKRKYKSGIWYMTPEFCRGADITTIVMTIEDDAIQVKTTDGDNIADTSLKYSMSESFSTMFDPYKATYEMTVGDDNELGFPETMTCEVDLTDGTMRIYKEDTEYADLRKFMV